MVISRGVGPLNRWTGGLGNGDAFLMASSAALSKALFLELLITLIAVALPSGTITKPIIVCPSICLALATAGYFLCPC